MKGNLGSSATRPSEETTNKSRFLHAIEKAHAGGKLSSNILKLLKDLAKIKESTFFDVVVTAALGDDDSHRINHLDEIISSKVQQVLLAMYENCSFEMAKTTSQKERAQHSMTQGSLVYGEVEFESFLRILNYIPMDKKGKFYDLGSGAGRAVFTARLVRDFDECIGIELLPNLHALAESICRVFNDSVDLPFRKVSFDCQDFLEGDWSDGNVVFAHSTCFENDLLQAVFAKAKLLSSGAYFITFRSTGIDMEVFDLVQQLREEMSWGEADVFIFRRC